LNMLKDIQREVEIEESRGDRGRSNSISAFNQYQPHMERERAYTVSQFGAGYEQPPLPPSVVRDDDAIGQATNNNYYKSPY